MYNGNITKHLNNKKNVTLEFGKLRQKEKQTRKQLGIYYKTAHMPNVKTMLMYL